MHELPGYLFMIVYLDSYLGTYFIFSFELYFKPNELTFFS